MSKQKRKGLPIVNVSNVQMPSVKQPAGSKDKWDRITGFCCATCMYCSPKPTTLKQFLEKDTGRCRRHAPSMQGYPVVYLKDDWCGDHKVGTNPHKAKEISITGDVEVRLPKNLKKEDF